MTEPQNTEPAGDNPSGPENDPQIAVGAPEDATVDADTEAVFADAFGPDGGEPTAEEYASAIRTMGLEDEVSTPVETSDANADDDDTDDTEPASAREARYRVRAREAEGRLADAAAENTRLQNAIDAMRRSQAVALAAARLADPAGDLFREHGLDAVLADDGTVDAQRVNELTETILRDHPHYGVQKPAVNPGALRSGARKADEAPVPIWQRAFAPRAK